MSAKKKKVSYIFRISLPLKIFLIGTVPLFFTMLLWLLYQKNIEKSAVEAMKAYKTFSIEEDFLTPNEYSRPQKSLKNVRNIVIHYTANAGSDAQANRDYFENLKDTKETYASSHFIVGLDGTIIQCIPLDEIAYASNDRNADTIAIECCHPNNDGKYTKATYQSLLRLCAYLCKCYRLSASDLIRHYDVTGKLCPKYYVEHPKKWERLKQDVQTLIDQDD